MKERLAELNTKDLKKEDMEVFIQQYLDFVENSNCIIRINDNDDALSIEIDDSNTILE